MNGVRVQVKTGAYLPDESEKQVSCLTTRKDPSNKARWISGPISLNHRDGVWSSAMQRVCMSDALRMMVIGLGKTGAGNLFHAYHYPPVIILTAKPPVAIRCQTKINIDAVLELSSSPLWLKDRSTPSGIVTR